MFRLILYRITLSLLCRKNNLISREEIKETNQKLIKSVRWLNIKIMIKNNFDIKSSIIRLFYCSLVIDMLFLGLAGTAVILYTGPFFYDFLDCKISDLDKANWPWIGILITNILYIFFIIRVLSDYYKLSLRDTYRNNYQKLLFLDILTLNIFSVLGTIFFIKNKKWMLKLHHEFQPNNDLNLKLIKDYFKIISKVEIFIFLINLVIFVTALTIGYFIYSNTIKVICLFFIIWNMIILYAWSGCRIIGGSVVRKMFKTLLNNDSYYYLLTTIRFLIFIFGGYYSSLLINLLKLDESFKAFILENW